MQHLTFETKIRLFMAILCFAALATMAGLTLEDWRLRAVVWIVLGGLAAKTWIAAVRRDE